MRDYAKVSPKFWTGLTGKSLRKHPEAQIVAFYLMTCPTSEMTGVFVCPLIYIAHETGLGEEGALKGLARLYEVDFCTFDEASETIFVHEMAKYQIGEELKVNDNQVKSVRKAFSAMKGIIRERFFERYEASFHLSDESPCKAPSKPRAGTSEGAGAGAGESSVPNGTGGSPPSGQSGTAKTPEQMTKDELWAAGKSILEAAGMPKAQCGTFVGGLVKQYTAEIVHASVLAAVIERPADPASFLKAACMARKGEGGKSLIPWHATDAGVIAKGAELGMSANRGETSIQFKARVIAAADNAGKPPAARASPPATVMAAEPKRVEVPVPPELKAKRSEELKAAMRPKTT
jgi:hypothetical protein